MGHVKSQLWWLLAEDSLGLPRAKAHLLSGAGSRPLALAAPRRGQWGPGRAGAATRAQPRAPRARSPRRSRCSGPGERGRGKRPRALGGGRRSPRGRAASGFLLEPVSGAAAGGPGHVMPGPGGGQAEIQRQPAGAERGGRPPPRAQPARPRSAASAPPPRAARAAPPPGVGRFGRSCPAPAARSGRPRAGRGGSASLGRRRLRDSTSG